MDDLKIKKLIEKYNFWDSTNIQLWYIRKGYISKIYESIWNKNLIKVLIWQRRTGKSYIIRQLINYLIKSIKINKKNILYINMEYDEFNFIKNKDDLNHLIKVYRTYFKPKWRIYLFIDEIQEIESREKFVNSIRSDHTLDIEIIISGSNSKLLSSELSTYLAWRYISFDIYPFSFAEYLWFNNTICNKDSFLKYINFSWIPELYNLWNYELQRSFVDALKNTIILKDLVLRYKIKDVALLENVFLFLVNNIWNLFSINSIVRKLKSLNINISPTTLSNYLKYFEDVFVFHSVSRFDVKWKKILEWEKKYYLNDLWFLNFWFSSFENYIWKKLENYVYNYLIWKWYKVYVWNMWEYEIDFICEKKDTKCYIQVTYLVSTKEVIEREYSNLRLIKDSFPKYVISLDDIILPTDDYWIKHIQIWDIEKYI